MNQTKIYFPLIFISLEDEPWEPIEPNAAPAEEPVAAEPGLSESDWTLASTETVTHEYLTQNGKVARETMIPAARLHLTILSTGVLQAPIITSLIYRAMLFRSLTQMASCKQNTSTPRGAR